jgi:predicted Zn-dependent protease
MPWSAERRLGALVAPPLQGCRGREGAVQLARLTARLYPLYPEDASFPLDVDVVRGKTVNAFALPGGRVHVYEGLLAQARSPEELAGVLAHEIEHVRRRHIVQSLVARLVTLGALRLAFSGGAPLAETVLSLSFSRQQETEADEGGLRRLRDARVDTAGFAAFFERVSRGPRVPALLSDHPAGRDRAALARRYSGGPISPIMSPDDWKALQAICR